MGGARAQERFERSPAGRAAISAVIVVLLFCVLVTNLPSGSYAHKTLSKKTQPVLNAIGLDQNWGVFAPDPRRESLKLEVRMTYPDGTEEKWRPPERNDVIGGYSDYRWRKLLENVFGEESNRSRAGQLALWVVRHERKRRAAPTTVTVYKSSAQSSPPGSGMKRQPYAEAQFFQTQLDPRTLEAAGP